jgi:hypothetical protein
MKSSGDHHKFAQHRNIVQKSFEDLKKFPLGFLSLHLDDVHIVSSAKL